jgi:hypothetical protein
LLAKKLEVFAANPNKITSSCINRGHSMPVKINAVAWLAMSALMTGCAGVSLDTPAPVVSADTTRASTPQTYTVKSIDGNFDGEIIGMPASDSKFAKLKIGMSMQAVTGLIGGADFVDRHETGKRWIPFYFGTDAQRVEALYKGEGCLTYTGGNVFGEGGAQLIRVVVDATGTCME